MNSSLGLFLSCHLQLFQVFSHLTRADVWMSAIFSKNNWRVMMVVRHYFSLPKVHTSHVRTLNQPTHARLPKQCLHGHRKLRAKNNTSSGCDAFGRRSQKCFCVAEQESFLLDEVWLVQSRGCLAV